MRLGFDGMGGAMYSLGGSNEPPELANLLLFYFIYNIYIFYLRSEEHRLNSSHALTSRMPSSA